MQAVTLPAPAEALADATIWLDESAHIVVQRAHVQPTDPYEAQLRRVRRIAHHDGAEAFRGITRWGLYESPEAHVLASYTDLRLRAARDSARIIRSTDATAQEKAEAWNHLFELGCKIGIGLGPPRSILSDTHPGDLERVQHFDAQELVDAMVAELMSPRLDNLELIFPLDGLRVNVEIERERHYKDALSALHSADKIETQLPGSEEPIARWEPGVVVAVDLDRVLAQLRQRGLPPDAARLLLERFHRGGSDADIARDIGWSECRLEAAQAALRPARWGKVVHGHFRSGHYILPPHRAVEHSRTRRPIHAAHTTCRASMRWPQCAAHARTGKFGGHRVIFLSANHHAIAP